MFDSLRQIDWASMAALAVTMLFLTGGLAALFGLWLEGRPRSASRHWPHPLRPYGSRLDPRSVSQLDRGVLHDVRPHDDGLADRPQAASVLNMRQRRQLDRLAQKTESRGVKGGSA